MSVEQKAPTVKDVFDCAHEIASPDERQAYVERVCRETPDIRAKVEALLKAYDEAGSILEPPTVGDAATGPYEPAAEQPAEGATAATIHPAADSDTLTGVGPGSQIGLYRLIQPLGEGGMGAVYLAEQAQPVRRQVALKIIKPGMDSAQVVARFEAERQALALMEHPNIARVLDAGTIPTGQPFFVMELVQGVPMTRFCDKQKLTLRERLQLFIPVCQAIQHAHHKGIIHRDIKPSNILVSLVDGKPVPKVIDFGIAKAMLQPLTEQPAFTQMGAVLGTLEYMSPEQADGNPLAVDTRTDVYSLGVLLYELLTGVTPLDQGKLRQSGLVDALLMIINEEAPRPGTRLSGLGERQTAVAAARQTEPVKLVRALRGELDWIVMKALEKDRTRRYESASELAADVQRYLDDEAVLACPPTMRYRAGKFARKHWIGLTLAGAFATLLVGGVAALAITLVVVSHAKSKAQAALVAERRAQTQTRDLLGYSAHAIGSLVSKQQSVTGQTAVLRDLLTKYQNVAADWTLSTEDRQLVTEGRDLAAAGQSNVALIREFLGELAAAETGYRKAVESYLAMAAEAPGEVRFRTELADTYNKLAL
ncbi:MAG TPA: serine/threonine-protein kinase, partial [Gemmataceae bacterium]|nr:serine/threonine-protein kinase [Gemmataceae bacterium]